MIPSECRQPLSVCACRDPRHPRPFSAPAATKPWPAGLHLMWEEAKSLQRTSQTQLSYVWSHLGESPGSCNTAHTVPGTLLSLLRNKGHHPQFQGLRWRRTSGGSQVETHLGNPDHLLYAGPCAGPGLAGEPLIFDRFLAYYKTSTGLL